VGVGWAKPADGSLRDQYVVEIFYRLQIAENVAITLDLQLLIDPALNPAEDVIVVVGVRGRLAF